MERSYIDAMIMGLTIGLGAFFLEVWVGKAGWPLRVIAFLVIGATLCAIQYGLIWLRRRR
ncbi:MAG: hypothetical protein HGA19_09905 [Oscillochloris sp.]|nr:hypothetical protein [Oscillochloris sp.]